MYDTVHPLFPEYMAKPPLHVTSLDNRGNFRVPVRHTILVASMLENRKSPRQKMVLPVKVSIDKDTHLAHTLDISGAGARLGALRTQVQPGTIVTLQRGAKKAKFRITWVRQLAPLEVQVGIEALELQENFWGVNLSERDQSKKDMQAFLSLLGDSKAALDRKPVRK